MQGQRYHLLDALRGITIISMIVYHGLWDVVYILDVPVPWYFSKGAYYWQQSICYTFILLSGFCLSLGKRRIKRGLQVFLCGTLVSVVTILFLPDEQIIFGVLFMLGASMMLVSAGYTGFSKVPPVAGLLISGLLFLLTKPMKSGYLGIGDIRMWKLPEELYDRGYFMTFLGLKDKHFYSSDYFPLFPWFFLFLVGFYFYHYLQQRKQSEQQKRAGKEFPSIPVLSFLGRHSLLIYMLHQPVLYGIAMVVQLFMVK